MNDLCPVCNREFTKNKRGEFIRRRLDEPKFRGIVCAKCFNIYINNGTFITTNWGIQRLLMGEEKYKRWREYDKERQLVINSRSKQMKDLSVDELLEKVGWYNNGKDA